MQSASVTAICAAPVQRQLDPMGFEAGWRNGWRSRFGKAKQAAAPVALEMRMATVRVGMGRAEAAHAILPGDAVGQLLRDQPVEHAVQRDLVERMAVDPRLLHEGVVRLRRFGGKQHAQRLYARGGGGGAARLDQADGSVVMAGDGHAAIINRGA